MPDLDARRRYFAEEIQAVANITSPPLVEAFASVPRERYLPPGPWTVRSEGDLHAPPRRTPDAHPRHIYHNVAVAIDASRMLFNGGPSVVAMAIDALRPHPGDRVFHLGTGLGYYTAILAHCVGSSGLVLGIEVDAVLAEQARSNLAGFPWVDIRHGDGSGPIDGQFDAMLINAGVTHPRAEWLDALAPGGRMVLPLTATMPPMTTIGKGPMILLTRTEDPQRFDARFTGFVAIYSAVGLRDDATNAQLGKALARFPFAPVKSFRRDPHEPTDACWLHAPTGCWGS